MNYKKSVLESSYERWFYEHLARIGGVAVKNTHNGLKSLPDRTIYLPGGITCFAEFKQKGKKLTPGQGIKINRFIEMGFRVYIIDSSEKCADVIEQLKTLVTLKTGYCGI